MRKGSGGSGGAAAGLYHSLSNNVIHHPQFQHLQQNLQHHHLGGVGAVGGLGAIGGLGGIGGAQVQGPLHQLPPHLQQQLHHQLQQHQQLQQQQQQGSMVQQRQNSVGGGGGGNGGNGRVYLSHQQQQQQHHVSQQGGVGVNPYLQHQGMLLGHHHNHHHQHGGGGGGGGHLGGGATPILHHSMHHHSQRPIIPHGGAGFGPHPSGMGQGLNLAQNSQAHGGIGGQFGGHVVSSTGINSHFGTSGNSAGGSVGGSNNMSGSGGVGSGPGSGHSSSGGGDLPPVETVVARLETACRLLHGIGGNNTRVAEISSEIQILSEDLRRVGQMLENTYPEVLDRVMSSMRDASAQPCLPPSLRLAIFELVELRASKWILPSDSSNYYRQRRNLNDAAAPADGILDERSGRSSAASGSGSGGGGGSGPGSQVTVIVTGAGAGASPQVSSSGGGGGASGNPVKPEAIYSGGGGGNINNNNASQSQGTSQGQGVGGAVVDLDTPPQPQPAKTYREEIVIKNSDSGKVMGVRGRRVHLIEAISDTIISFEKVAPTAKERVLSINGYSQQSINLAKQLIQETITRNASPVLDGMVLPGSTSPAGASGDFQDLASGLSLEEAELALKRMQLQTASNSVGGGVGGTTSSLQQQSKLLGDHHPHHHGHSGSPHHSSSSSHFSYTVTLGDHSIKILGDDLQYVQEAKMALDDYFLQKYPDLFCANGIEDVDEEGEEEEEEGIGGDEGEEEEDDDEDFQEADDQLQRYDRETLLSLSKVRTPPPNFSHLEPDIRGNIVLEKPRQFDLEKFARETNSTITLTPTTTSITTVTTTTNTTLTTSSSTPTQQVAAVTNANNIKATPDNLPG